MLDVDDDTDVSGAAPTAEDFREMRSQARKAKSLAAENADIAARLAAAEQRLAFADAGLTLSDRQRTALLAAHGTEDLTKEALLATAIELGFAQAAEPDEDSAAREAALAGAARVSAAASGARPPAAVPKLAEQIKQARDAGDLKLEGRLKAQELARQILAGQTVQVS